MKRIISILLILCLALFLCSCEKTPDEPAYTLKEPAMQILDNKTEVKEQTHSLSQIETEQVNMETENKTPPSELDLLTLDSIFSEHEVIVVPKTNSKYKLSDFPEADAFHIVGHDDYFSQNYHPEYLERRVYGLLLNEPSKENALETAKKLMDNPNVEFAAPSCDMISEKYFYAVLSDTADEYIYAEEDFPQLDIILDNGEAQYYESIENHNKKHELGICTGWCSFNDDIVTFAYNRYNQNRVVRMKATEDTVDAVYEQMKLALKDEKVIDIIPLYIFASHEKAINVYFYPEDNSEQITMDFFPYIEGELANLEEVLDGDTPCKQAFIYLKQGGKRNILDAVETIQKDKRVIRCSYFTNHRDYVYDHCNEDDVWFYRGSSSDVDLYWEGQWGED